MPCVTSSWMNFRMISPDSGVIAMNCSPMPHMPVPIFVRKVVDHAGLRRDLFFLQGDMHLDSDVIGIGLPRTKIHTVHGEIGAHSPCTNQRPVVQSCTTSDHECPARKQKRLFSPMLFEASSSLFVSDRERLRKPIVSPVRRGIGFLTFFPTPRPVRTP